jgi:hypothetical protein
MKPAATVRLSFERLDAKQSLKDASITPDNGVNVTQKPK